MTELPFIGFAEKELAKFQAVVRQLSLLGLDIEFILGVNAFADYRVQFDYPKSRVYIIE